MQTRTHSQHTGARTAMYLVVGVVEAVFFSNADLRVPMVAISSASRVPPPMLPAPPPLWLLPLLPAMPLLPPVECVRVHMCVCV
jgi:hypothetical protein